MAHRITLTDGRGFDAAEDHTLLACADAAGVRFRRGCKVGSCRTCAVRLVKGRVAQQVGTALTDAQRAEKWILPCVSYARGPATLDASGEGLPVLPWTE